MKFWKWLPAIYTAHACAFATLGYLVGPSWYGMVCTAVAGYFLGTALWVTHCNRWRALFEQAKAALETITDINDALTDFCTQCSIDNFGKDFGDMAAISKEADTRALFGCRAGMKAKSTKR